MNHRSVLSITVILLLASVFLVAVKVQPASANTVIVPDDYSTIQEAINNANVGDTVFVRNGTYFESLTVNKRMTLVGENREGTAIDGKNATNTVSITSSGVAIQSFCIKGSYVRGIFVNSNNITIQNCIVAENRQDGINVFSSQYCTFEDNLFYGNHQAMDVGHSSQNNIVSNRFVGNHVGILLSYSNENMIQDNEVVDSGFFGIDVQDQSSDNQITGNRLINNDYGFVIISAGNNRFYHNNLIDNTHQTYLNGALYNKWDDGCEGNYWSDYHGNDSDHDGVGDTPYVIDSNNIDHCPLMNLCWCPADVNHDLRVGILDVVRICASYELTPSDLGWNPHADIAEPYGKIDILDVVTCTSHYGEKYP